MKQSSTNGDVSSSRFQAMRRMRTIATGLLFAMAATFILARTLEVHHPGWGWLRAFAEAAMVGAIADWFAVVALFRNPLGVPLPHTAIIPNSKERIGESLGRFVIDNFLTDTVLRPKLEKLDLVGTVAIWLVENSRAVAERLGGVIPVMLQRLDDAAVRRFLHQQLIGQLRTIEVAPMTGKLLEALTEGDRHKPLLVEGLKFLDGWMHENDAFLRNKVRNGLPLPLKLVDGLATNYIMDKLFTESATLIHEVSENPHHPFYQKFRATLEKQIQALRASPEYLHKGEEFKAHLLNNPALRAYVSDMWTTLESWIQSDLAKPDSQIKEHLRDVVSNVGQALRDDPELRAKLNTWLKDGLLAFVTKHREQAARLIQETVAKWEAEDICRNLEAEVGRDLQFIRINGTIVGGLVGITLHWLTILIWH